MRSIKNFPNTAAAIFVAAFFASTPANADDLLLSPGAWQNDITTSLPGAANERETETICISEEDAYLTPERLWAAFNCEFTPLESSETYRSYTAVCDTFGIPSQGTLSYSVAENGERMTLDADFTISTPSHGEEQMTAHMEGWRTGSCDVS